MEVRSQLIQYFERVRIMKPQYSLRAFARDLKMDVSTLSRVLSGKRRLTELQASRIANRLLMAGGSDFIPSEPEYRSLTLEEHLLMSRWYVAGIQELTHTSGFDSDPEWIARRLNISVNEVESVVTVLVEKGFLKWDENDRLVDCLDHWYSDLYESHEEAKRANRKKHRELCDRSVKAYEELNPDEVSFTRITFSGDPKQMDKAKELIARFRRDLNAIFQLNTRDRTEVFMLQMNLFPLTQKMEEAFEDAA